MNVLLQKINTTLAIGILASVGIGATYIITSFAQATDFSYSIRIEEIEDLSEKNF